MSMQPVMSKDELSEYVRQVFPQAEGLGATIVELENGRMTVEMSASDDHLRPGGTVSGPTMFALADVAAYLVILAHVGKVALAVTTSLNINFMAKPGPGKLSAEVRLIKLGKRLAVCEVHIYSFGLETMVAQATATYSIPPNAGAS